MFTYMKQKPGFYKQVFFLAAPIVLQNLRTDLKIRPGRPAGRRQRGRTPACVPPKRIPVLWRRRLTNSWTGGSPSSTVRGALPGRTSWC